MIILKILLLIILYLFLFLLGLLIILIASPIKGYLRFDIRKVYFKGSYLFGAIKIIYNKGITLKLFGFKLKDSSQDTGEKKEKEKKEKKKKDKNKEEKDKKDKLGLPSKEVIFLSVDLFKKLVKKIAPRRAMLHLTLGLDEPYITEMIHIISMIGFSPLNRINNYDFSFTPVNNDIDIDYEGEALVNFSILSLIIPCLRYIIRKPIRLYFNITFKKKSS